MLLYHSQERVGRGKLSFVEYNYYGFLLGGVWLPGLRGSFLSPHTIERWCQGAA